MKVKEESEKGGLKLNIQKAKIMASSPIPSWQIDGEKWKQWDFIILGSKITANVDWSHEIAPWKKIYDQHRQHIKKQRHYFANKGPSSQSYGFSSSHIWMWDLGHKEGWFSKNWCFLTLEKKTLEHTWDIKEIKLVNPKGNQFWMFIGRTDAEAEAVVLLLPNGKSQLIGKDPDAGKDWRQKENGSAEDKMVGWHHWLNGYAFEQAPRNGEGQGILACCSLWGCKELDPTEQLNSLHSDINLT